MLEALQGQEGCASGWLFFRLLGKSAFSVHNSFVLEVGIAQRCSVDKPVQITNLSRFLN